MTPEEMQTRIELLREEWRTVCLLASEPGQTSVHPTGTIDRDEAPVTHHASDEAVESVLAEF